jgi:predicted O-linked N-acetylglucosamine transferase (SPINDLY family)
VLTIGYLSADFHRHATAYLAAELFELHDRARFRAVAYSAGPDDGSDIRHRLEAGFDLFRHLPGWPAAEIAQAIRADGVDILVDLKGYTRDARTDVMGLRPAPIQVAYLGYPGAMGVDFIDYVLADPVVLPTERQPDYAERIVHLPWCYQVNDRQRPHPPAPDRTASGLPATGPVLACFNAAYKITPAVFAVWMRLLRTHPDAVLWLLSDEEAVERALRQRAEGHGVAGDRLIFAPHRPLADHLARYALADLVLDTLPYNAHTTGSDALWMGCPIVTCRGATFAGRVGASLLHAVGLDELIVDDLESYEARAGALLADPAALADLRRRLTEGRDTAPLFDTPAFVRNVETAFSRMWERRCQRLPPQSFAV